jgi:hypothetical protein
MYERCAGMDVHKKVVVVCFRRGARKKDEEVRSFSTMTESLIELRGWLLSVGCTHLAMESTGLYWEPIWNLLEECRFEGLLLFNAAHIKHVPGRKTEMIDAQWIASLFPFVLVGRPRSP